MSTGSVGINLKTKLIVLYAAPLVILLVSLGFMYDMAAKNGMEKEMGERLKTIAMEVSTKIPEWKIKALLNVKNSDTILKKTRSSLKKWTSKYGVDNIYIFDLSNRSLADSRDEIPTGMTYFQLVMDKTELEKALSGHTVSSRLFKGKDGRYYKTAYAPIFVSGKPAAIIAVEASASFFKGLYKVRKQMALLLGGGILLIIIISTVLSRKIVKPLQQLVEAASRIGKGNLKTAIDIKAKGEVGFLAATMEEMRKNIVERDIGSKMMLRGIAHEIKNPLGAIELHCGLIKDEASGDILEYAKTIQHEVKNLKDLIDEFLAFGKDVVLEKQIVDIRSFIENSILPIKEELRKRKIKAFISIEENLKNFEIDPSQLRRALINIYVNSLQAMGKNGKLNINVTSYEKDTIKIRIEDNGPGIAPDIIANIFEPFFTTKKKGIGLGLAFAKKIVEAHKGYIRVDTANSFQNGAAFEIVVPKGYCE